MLVVLRRLTPSIRHIRYLSNQAPPSLTEGEQSIAVKLNDKFAPSELIVQDVSGPDSVPFYACGLTAFQGDAGHSMQYRLLVKLSEDYPL